MDGLVTHVDEDDKDAVGIHDAIGREQDTILINESGLYSNGFKPTKERLSVLNDPLWQRPLTQAQ